jgi:hypothetical protein
MIANVAIRNSNASLAGKAFRQYWSSLRHSSVGEITSLSDGRHQRFLANGGKVAFRPESVLAAQPDRIGNSAPAPLLLDAAAF